MGLSVVMEDDPAVVLTAEEEVDSTVELLAVAVGEVGVGRWVDDVSSVTA